MRKTVYTVVLRVSVPCRSPEEAELLILCGIKQAVENAGLHMSYLVEVVPFVVDTEPAAAGKGTRK
jgi:hypothetical protein